MNSNTKGEHRMKRLLGAFILATSLGLATPGVHADRSTGETPATRAWFEDHWIDLTVSWEHATACDVEPDITICYRTEAEMDTELHAARTATSLTTLAACSSSLRLYDGTSYTGGVLNLSTRATVMNLSVYGFDNLTSSYKVGGCDADFYSAANLGGSLYAGSTGAGSQATSMLSGWNNVVSSVYIS